MRVFAIGFKAWVELRTAKEPPKAEVSEVKIPYKDTIRDRVNGGTKVVNKSYRIRVVHHDGGKVVSTLPSGKFAGQTGIYIAEGEMVELTAAQAKRYL